MASPKSTPSSDNDATCEYNLFLRLDHEPSEVHTITGSDPSSRDQPVMINAAFYEEVRISITLDDWQCAQIWELEFTSGFGTLSYITVIDDDGLAFPEPCRGEYFGESAKEWNATLARAIENTRKRIEELISEEMIETPEMCGEGVIVDKTDGNRIYQKSTAGVEMESEDEDTN